MATDISICRTALYLVGANEINAFDDATREARLCSALYETTKLALIQKHRWSFSLEQVSLAKTVNEGLFGYKYEFQIPVNSLRVFMKDKLANRYTIRQDKLYADDDTVEILHQIDPGESEYPAHFVRALEFRMAEVLALALNQDESMSQLYERKFYSVMRESRGIDGQNQPNPTISYNEFSLIAVRGDNG